MSGAVVTPGSFGTNCTGCACTGSGMRGGCSCGCHARGRVELASLRAATAENERALRLRAAVEALDKCGLAVWGATLAGTGSARFEVARGHLQALRASLRDGSDEPRYAATGAALTALGALWAVS